MFEEAAEELFKKKPLGYEMKPELEIYTDGYKDGYNKAKEELQAQIERMKCCENCKHSDTECEGHTICGIGHYDDCLSNKVLYHTTDEKDYWELEEND